MKITVLFLAFVAMASSTLVSCQSTSGHHHSGGHHAHDHDPLPSGVRYAQERQRR